MSPCFGCTKELLQAGVERVYFLADWSHPDEGVRHEYERIQARIPQGIRCLGMDDPRADWAMGRGRATAETGHPIPGNEGGRVPNSTPQPEAKNASTE